MSRFLTRLLFLLLLPSLAWAQKPPINGVAGPTTSDQLRSIITDATGSGPLNFGTDGCPGGCATLGANTFTGLQTMNAGISVTASSGMVSLAVNGTTDHMMTMVVPDGSVALSGEQYPLDYLATYSGAPDGTSSLRTMRLINLVNGTSDMDQIHGLYNGLMDQREKRGGVNPVTFVNYTYHSYNLIQRDGDVSNAYVYFGHFGMGSHDFDSSGSVSVARVFHAGDTAWITDHTATGTISSMIGFNAGQLGHPTRVTNLAAFRAEDDTAASTAVAFLSQYLPRTGQLAFKDEGFAGSLFGGPVNVGDLVAPTDTSLQVRRTSLALPTASATGSVLSIIGSVTPNADGLSDFRAVRTSFTVSGANSFANATGVNNVVTDSHSAGTGAAVTGFGTTVTFSGTGTTTLIKGLDAQIRLGGDGIGTRAEALYARVLKTAGTTGTIGTSRGLHVDDSGGSHVTSEAIGVDVENFTNITGGGVKAAYRSKMNTATNGWAFYSAGTANSALAAGLRVGGITAPVATLDVTGSFAQTGSHTQTAGTITVDTPAMTATQTWNNVATAFIPLYLNVTNTASAANSKLMRLDVSSASKFGVDVSGNITAAGSLQTATVAGSSAGLWKLGALQTGAVVVDTTRSVFIDIGGVVYKVIVAQ